MKAIYYLRPIVILLIIFFCSLAGVAQTTSWKGTTDTRWTLPANWTNGVPTRTIDAIIGDINFTGTFQPTINLDTVCNNLTLGGGSKAVTLTASHTITIFGSLLINSNATIVHSVDGKDINVKGNWTNNGSYNATSTKLLVRLQGTGSINGTSTTHFKKLSISTAGTVVTSNVDIIVDTLLTVIGTFIPAENVTPVVVSGTGALNVQATGILKVNATTYAGNYTLSGIRTLDDNNVIEYSATLVNQTIDPTITYSTLTISGALVKTLGGNLTPLVSTVNSNGKINVNSGTLDLSIFTADRGLPQGGVLKVLGGAILKIGGSNTLPANFRIHTFDPSSTVEYSGTNQTVTDTTAIGTVTNYGNLILSSSSGAVVKTADSAMIVLGDLTIGTSTTLNGASYIHNISGNWVNNGTFTGSTSTITMLGAGTTLTGTGTNNFYNLTINGAGITAAAITPISVAGDLTSNGSGTFTHAAGGTVTLTGATNAIDGTGFTFDNLTVPGTITTDNDITVTGNLSVDGSLTSSTTITMSGTSKIISGSGAIGFSTLLAQGSLTCSADFSIASAMNVTGSFTASAGTATFTGDYNPLSGTANLFDVVLNSGGTLELQTNAVLGIANTFSIISGNFDINTNTPNTVNFNGTGAQSVYNTTYDNLILSNGGIKTAVDDIATNNDFTIGTGTTFDASSFTHTINGNWTNSGTFTGGTSTIIFTGTGTAVGGSGVQNFNSLTVAAAGITFAAVNLTLTGNLATTGAGSFSQAAGGTLFMSGTGTTISGTGISLNNLSVSGTVTTDADFSISSNLAVAGGSFSATAGTLTFNGTSILSGTANLFNATLNGTSIQLLKNSVLGIANVFTIAGGIFDVTTTAPNTVNFNGTVAQNVNSTTYSNLILSNGNTKTAAGSITTNNNINIASTTTFNGSSFVHTVNGNWTNSGTFTGNTSSVIFTGAGTNVGGGGVQNFNNFTVAASGITASPVNISVSGNLATTGAGSFTQDSGGTMKLTGTSKTIAGSGFIFANLTVQGTVTTSTNITLAGNLSVSGSFTNTGTIQIAGSISNSGTFDVTNGTVEMNGSSPQTIPAHAFSTNTILNLILSNDVTLADTTNLTGILSFGMVNSKTFSTAGFLTLKSSATGTANVADITNDELNSDNQITGDVTVERYISAVRKAWWFLAIPTNTGQTVRQTWQEGAVNSGSNPVAGYGTQITGPAGTAAGFDATTSTPSMKKYNSANNTWIGIPNTASAVSAIDGYMTFIRGDRTANALSSPASPTVLRTSGSLFTGGQVAITVAANEFASIGNPYAATLDMRKIKKPGIKDFFYLWDPYLDGSNGLGGYQTFSSDGDGNYVITPGGGSHVNMGEISDSILSGHAFFVQADTGGGTLTFDEPTKFGNGSPSRPARLTQPQLRTGLYGVNADNSTYMIDGTLSDYDDSYSNNVDDMDAIKLPNTSENLSIKTAGKLLVIERRHTITGQDTIFLNLTGTKVQKYRFQFTANRLDGTGLTAFLEDTYLHTSTALGLTGSTFADFNIVNIAGSYVPARFRIVFKQLTVLPVTFTSIKAYEQNKDIAVEWKVDNEMNMKKYDVEKSFDGNNYAIACTVSANNSILSNYRWLDVQPGAGYHYYRLLSTDKDGKTAYSTAVKVFIGKGTQSISIYPNPVVNGVINLQLTNQPAGPYGLRLLNKLGQVMISKQINHVAGSSSETLQMDRYSAHGIYQLEVTKPDGKVKKVNVIY